MKTGWMSAAALATAILLTGCGDKGGVDGKTGKDISASSSSDDIGEAYLNEMTRIADALESVKDESSAKAAATRIHKATEGMESMQAKLEGELDGVKAMQIFGSRYTDLIKVQQRMATEMVRIQTEHPDLMSIIDDELKDID